MGYECPSCGHFFWNGGPLVAEHKSWARPHEAVWAELFGPDSPEALRVLEMARNENQ